MRLANNTTRCSRLSKCCQSQPASIDKNRQSKSVQLVFKKDSKPILPLHEISQRINQPSYLSPASDIF